MDYNLQKAITQRYLPAGIYTLLELSHSKFDKTYRLINNTESVEIDGEQFEPYPFNFKPKNQGDNSTNPLVLSNVVQTVVRELMKATENEDIVVRVWFAIIEKMDGQCFIERRFAGKFIVDDTSITNESTSLSLDLDTSLKFNIGTIRFSNPSLFPNLNK